MKIRAIEFLNLLTSAVALPVVPSAVGVVCSNAPRTTRMPATSYQGSTVFGNAIATTKATQITKVNWHLHGKKTMTRQIQRRRPI